MNTEHYKEFWPEHLPPAEEHVEIRREVHHAGMGHIPEHVDVEWIDLGGEG